LAYGKLMFCFLELSEHFFPALDLCLVESTDVETMDLEGWLHILLLWGKQLLEEVNVNLII
jgi:hypothetical protein